MTFSSILCVALLAGCSLGPTLEITVGGNGAGEITSDPGGVHCDADCTMSVDRSLTLIATASVGSAFVGWSGACEGTEPCVLALSTAAPTSVAARFDAVFHDLTVVRTGTGSGTVTSLPAGIACGTTCAAILREGPVSLTAVPDAGSVFAGWSGGGGGGGGVGGGATSSFTLAQSTEVTATFSPAPPAPGVTIERAGTGGGTVTSAPAGIDCGPVCTAPFPSGSVVRLTAIPDATSTFEGWSGLNGCAGNGTCTTTISAATTFIATFQAIAPLACTTTVTASEAAATFNARLTIANAVICLGDGVTITGRVVLGADGITVQRVPGATAHIINPIGDAIDLAHHHAIRIVGLDISSDGGNLASGIVVDGASLELRDATVHCESNNCYVVKIVNSLATIASSTLSGGNPATAGSYSYGLYGWNGANAQISDSTITSTGTALDVTVQSNFRVTACTIRGLNRSVGGGVDSSGTITVYNGASLDLADSTVVTYGFAAIMAGAGAKVRLDHNVIRKAAGQPPGDASSPIRSDTATDVLMSSWPNTFCNEGTATTDGAFIAPLIGGVYAATSTFDGVAQVGPGNCAP